MTPTGHQAGPSLPVRVVLLVGFMGSGKTAVGSRVAERLGWCFLDADDEVEARTGSSIERLFEDRGEIGFREIEAEITRDLLEGSRRVVASGGGWPAAEPGRLDGLPADVLTVWLRVPAEVAVERVARDRRSRPLLRVQDPETRARELVEVRNPSYARARLHLDAAEASPDDLADAVVRHLAPGSD